MEFQIGDIVEFGGIQGTVEEKNKDTNLGLYVLFSNGQIGYFTVDGRVMASHTKPLLNLISRPKKMVKVQVKRWVNIYKDEYISATHVTKEIADIASAGTRLACVELTGEYEIEEKDDNQND